jgi:hypothetical protein
VVCPRARRDPQTGSRRRAVRPPTPALLHCQDLSGVALLGLRGSGQEVARCSMTLSCGSGLISPTTGLSSLGGRLSLDGGPSRACCLRRLGTCCGCLRPCGLLWPGGLIPGCMRVGRWRMLICLPVSGPRMRTLCCGGSHGPCRLISGCGRSVWRLTGLMRGFRRYGGGMRTGFAMIRRGRIRCGGATRSGIRGSWTWAP